MRQNIEVEEMRSGEDDHLLWVSLGFKSELSEYDVLFIVCGKEMDEESRRRGMYGLYFERFDQLNSCYHAAENIAVSSRAVSIDFTDEGSRELKLPRAVRFDCSSVIPELREASGVFTKMSEYEWGGAIKSV